jgi:polyhydroxyalkanoate synthase
VWAPSNFPWTNPEVLPRAGLTGGTNLVRGAAYFAEDWSRLVSGDKPVGADKFPVGARLASTPGRVVLRSELT